MKITLDTNVLVRLVMADDPAQNAKARTAIENAVLVAIGLSSLCEMAWVLRRHYAIDHADIANAIRRLTSTSNVVTNRLAVEAGLSVLDAGGDFADGVIAHEGGSLGGETFVSFDRRAVKLLNAGGRPAELLR